MVTWCVKGCSNQSSLKKNVSYRKIPRQWRKKILDAWIKAIARPVLSKAVHVCSDHFTEDSFDESQELKRRVLGGNLKCIIKPDVAHPYFQMLGRRERGRRRGGTPAPSIFWSKKFFSTLNQKTNFRKTFTCE